MKTLLILLILILPGLSQLDAQTNRAANTAIVWQQFVNDAPEDERLPADACFPCYTHADSVGLPTYHSPFTLQSNRLQKMKAIMLFTSGSIISALGIGYGIRNDHTITNKINATEEENYNHRTYNRLALTGLVIIAGSIPCLINALKNKHKAGLKLTSQQTTFGYGHRPGKKVTSLTYSIPFGHKSRY